MCIHLAILLRPLRHWLRGAWKCLSDNRAWGFRYQSDGLDEEDFTESMNNLEASSLPLACNLNISEFILLFLSINTVPM